MHTSEAGLKLIENFEGFVDHIYDDGTGVLTVGYGTTSADIHPLPTHVTRAQAEQLLVRELASKYEPAVNGVGVPLNQNQFDALVSLAYNCGPGIVSDAYQIGRDLRARNYSAASADFMHYVVAGGRVLQGLVNRRTAERSLFNKPVADPKKASGTFKFEGSYDHDNRVVHVHGTSGDVKSWGDVNETIHLQIDLPVGPKAGKGDWSGHVTGASSR